MDQRRARTRFAGAAVLLLPALAAVATAQVPPAPDAPAIVQPPPPVEDPTLTVRGALTLFMGSRHYATIRQLKSVMTPALQARYDKYSATFNGKRGIRIALFEFDEKELLKAGTRGRDAAVTVRTLWEEQGEAMELRTESVRLAKQADGLWRVSGLDKVTSENARFADAVPGITTLRILLRGWHRRNAASARGQLSPAFLKRHAKGGGAEEALKTLFEGEAPPDPANGAKPHRAAYRILSCEAQGDSQAEAKVMLFEGTPDRPLPIDGPVVRIVLVKKGPYWLLDSWD